MVDISLTIFCSFTRRWNVDRWIEDLKTVNFNPEITNFAAVVDTDEPAILGKLKLNVEKMGFKDYRFKINPTNNPDEAHPSIRRLRVAEVKQQSKQLISELESDFVLGLEDDVVFTNLDLNKLLLPFSCFDKVGFVEGVQCGRWGVKMVGVWACDLPQAPTRLETLIPSTGYQEIDGGGFYGYLTTKDLYLGESYRWEGESWGPDVNWGLDLRKKGYINYVNWDLKFGHRDHDQILWPDGDIKKYALVKKQGFWVQEFDE